MGHQQDKDEKEVRPDFSVATPSVYRYCLLGINLRVPDSRIIGKNNSSTPALSCTHNTTLDSFSQRIRIADCHRGKPRNTHDMSRTIFLFAWAQIMIATVLGQSDIIELAGPWHDCQVVKINIAAKLPRKVPVEHFQELGPANPVREADTINPSPIPLFHFVKDDKEFVENHRPQDSLVRIKNHSGKVLWVSSEMSYSPLKLEPNGEGSARIDPLFPWLFATNRRVGCIEQDTWRTVIRPQLGLSRSWVQRIRDRFTANPSKPHTPWWKALAAMWLGKLRGLKDYIWRK
ncbi:hypothetical protein Pst134EA_007401 [Puccinia striiformis f. sp. tritici]|uniref:Uncharacterized protein n=1 Tax=Puccinia striiformis f. sp. tritici PST-78 TaxID=1165861 RepID=A0A0L0VQ46_9BASI|nr:hypothetical protein Pst134EA_007401 [Puccinia striiformis f. sp. tritici]KAH9470135.1 hypothetical protein Pst134EA_007401 [Puccinia striiformis f. sp. tritici]KNF01394.1 hypothetical protein PSTG_05492 [Puccinia striiformis f. sp. tritici PST-78]